MSLEMKMLVMTRRETAESGKRPEISLQDDSGGRAQALQ